MGRRGLGKQVATWVFKLDGQPVKVKPRMISTERGTTFFVKDAELDLDLEASNLVTLEKLVGEALKGSNLVDWSQWFLVRFGAGRFESDPVIQFKCDRIEVGWRRDGTVCWRNLDRNSTYIHDGEPDLDIDDDDDLSAQFRVPATVDYETQLKEFEATLEKFVKSFSRALRKLSGKRDKQMQLLGRMVHLLKPELK